MGKFRNCVFYLSGPMQYAKDQNWKKKLVDYFQRNGVPYFDPVVKDAETVKAVIYQGKGKMQVEEFEDSVPYFEKLLEEGKYDDVAKKMRIVREIDLADVRKSDIVIVYFDLETPTFGTWDEVYEADRCGKIILWIFNHDDLKKIPLWLYGVIKDMRLVFRNVDELLAFLDSDKVCSVLNRCICGKCWSTD